MTRFYLFIVVGMLLGGCAKQQHEPAEPAPTADPKSTAVTLSLKKFFAGNWSLQDPAIYITPSPYSDAVPKQLAGRPVEVISEEDLCARCGKREVAPEIVRINVYDVPSDPDIEFCVGISITGVRGKAAQFNQFPLGGTRNYEFSVVSGTPVLKRVIEVMH